MRMIASFFLLTVAAFAQSDRGSITGTVSDPANAVIPRAAVLATNTQTGVQYQSVTTQTGDYTISQIPAGAYSLSVEAPGFSRFIQQGIRIFVAQAARIDVVLQVGGTSESVTVTGEAPLLRTENAEQSTTITRETLNDLPLNFGQRWQRRQRQCTQPLYLCDARAGREHHVLQLHQIEWRSARFRLHPRGRPGLQQLPADVPAGSSPAIRWRR